VFVVEDAVSQATVEDPNEAVAEDSEGLVVEVTLGSALVVEVSTAGTGRDEAECPLVDGVGEAPVPDVAGQHDAFGGSSEISGVW
jgi:hypothetical protein